MNKRQRDTTIALLEYQDFLVIADRDGFKITYLGKPLIMSTVDTDRDITEDAITGGRVVVISLIEGKATDEIYDKILKLRGFQ